MNSKKISKLVEPNEYALENLIYFNNKFQGRLFAEQANELFVKELNAINDRISEIEEPMKAEIICIIEKIQFALHEIKIRLGSDEKIPMSVFQEYVVMKRKDLKSTLEEIEKVE